MSGIYLKESSVGGMEKVSYRWNMIGRRLITIEIGGGWKAYY